MKKPKVYFQPFCECLYFTLEKKETIYRPLNNSVGLLMDTQTPEKCIGVKIEMSTFQDEDDELLLHLISLKLRHKKGIIRKLKTLYFLLTRWRN